MKKIMLFALSICSTYVHMYAMIGGFAADQQLLQRQIQSTANQRSESGQSSSSSSSNGATSSNCQACPTPDAATSTPLPTFIINMYDAGNTLINTYSFSTNQNNFLVTNALLIVHIFPPSNIISNSKVTLASDDSSYAVMYTLKSLDGTIIQKELQYIAPATSSTKAAPAVMINKGVSQIPTSISIAAYMPATTATSTAAATTASTTFITPASTTGTSNNNVTFLPNMSPHSAMTKQRIFNGVSPMSQKFLISVDSSNNITATPISGMFDVDNSSDTPTLASSVLTSSNTATAVAATSGSAQSISITISDGNSPQTINFAGTTVPFNQQDLQDGLACNVHIFPPSTGGSNYMIAATLRTLDGLKLRKQIIQQTSFSNIPSQFSIAQGSNTILSTVFLNPSTSTQAANLVSPINLRCVVQKNNNKNIVVSMI